MTGVGCVLRKKATKAEEPTDPVSVSFKFGVRETLTKLIAVRKLQDTEGAPSSVIAIVDEAVLDFADYLKVTEDPAFLPVPASECIRVSLRVSARPSAIAQRFAAKHDVRLTDFYRTAITRYIRKHEAEITSYRAKPRRSSRGRA